MESVQQVPPNGWQYRVPKTNTTVIGSSKNDLISAVKNHLKHNGIASDNIEEEIRESYRKEYPDLNISF